MIKSDKKLANLDRVFKGGVHDEIEARIEQLRSDEPFEGAILALAHLHESTEDEVIRLAIASFFNDLKEPSARGEVIEALVKAVNPASKSMIASSCWQSGQDYSDHALTLAGLFIECDYITALECFTVLDTCASSVDESVKGKIVSLVMSRIKSLETTKQQLASELVSLFTEG